MNGMMNSTYFKKTVIPRLCAYIISAWFSCSLAGYLLALVLIVLLSFLSRRIKGSLSSGG